MLTPIFDTKLFAILAFAFMVFTVVGTLMHELGHYSVALSLGYEATINYRSARTRPSADEMYLHKAFAENREKIIAKMDFEGKAHYDALVRSKLRDSLLITWGGPLQTMLTGSLGLIFLVQHIRKRDQSEQLGLLAWLLVFLSLFWLRQPANLLMSLVQLSIGNKLSFTSDEFKLAYNHGLPRWSITGFTGFIGCLVLGYITFRIVPSDARLSFLLAGIFGGCLGYYLWFYQVGVIVLP